VISIIDTSHPPAPLWLTLPFSKPSFISTFLGLERAVNGTDKEALYTFVLRERLDDFVNHWRAIPDYTTYFDLIKHLPVDSIGCPIDYFPSLLQQATLIPIPAADVSRNRLCAFIMLTHTDSIHLDNFIEQMNDDNFIFLLVIDGKCPKLIMELKLKFSSNRNVFIVGPRIPMCWGCASLNYGPWVAIKAAFDFDFQCEWFSLHSGFDVLLHSRDVIKAFLLKYRGRADFYSDRWLDPVRSSQVWVFGSGCRPSSWLGELNLGLRSVFPNWTVWKTDHLRKGSQWWTLSQKSVRAILAFILHNPDFVRRISFVRFSDESLVQTILHRLKISRLKPCDIRSIDWPAMSVHPSSLNRTLVSVAWKRFALFARKIEPDDMDLVEFIHNHTRHERSRLPSNLVLPSNSTLCGIHK
jgi:hypothetical protein